MEEPLVSVIITTYKRPLLLERAINSVLNQTYKNIELIIVDDNDPNTEGRYKTEEIMSKYINNYKIKYIKHSKNKNAASARNTGIKQSSGKFLTYLDDDDFYRSDKVLKQVNFLEKNTGYNAVYCGWSDNNTKIIPTITGNLTYHILSSKQPVSTNTIMMDRLIAIEIGGWDESFIRNDEPVYMLRYFKKGYLIGVVSEVLVDVNLNDRSNVFSPKQHEENIRYFLDYHKDLIIRFDKKQQHEIYSRRYLAVLLNYIRNKDFKNGLILYTKLVTKMPISLNKEICKYIFSRLKY